jgi:DNA-binding response OmpR family regulator
MMGGISGFKLADLLRKNGNQTPVIFLTARNTENDMLTGFSIGGDDYISKPFSIKEVAARVKNVLKRSRSQAPPKELPDILKANNMSIDTRSKTFFIDNKEVELTKTEYSILLLLMQHEGEVLSRTAILNRAGGHDDVVVLERTVDVHISRLRKKLGPYADYITNRTGYGYVFNSINHKHSTQI